MTETKDHDLINEVGLLFLDAMSVKCEPSSYAIAVISIVRKHDAAEREKTDRKIEGEAA